MTDETHENPGSVIVEGSVAAPSVLRAPDQQHGKSFTDLQDRFVDHFIALGGKGTEAALAAGYGEGGAANIAQRNLANPKIQAEIARRLKLQTGSALATALGALFEVIEDGEDERARVQAALGIMDRFGMAPPKGPAIVNNVAVMNGNTAQSILIDVQQRREQRLARLSGPADD